MKDNSRVRWFLALIAIGIFSMAFVAATGQVAPAAKVAPKQLKATSVEDPGEKVFAANCARCHTPPMTLNPRVTGTVVMHMRVRARLSRKEEQQLLKFLAP